MQKKLMREFGGMLMELLLMLVIIGSLLPFIYRQNTRKKEAMENAAVAAEMTEIKTAVERYVEEQGSVLKGSLGGKVYSLSFSDLYQYGLSSAIHHMNKYGQLYSVKLRKITANNGVSTIKGLVYATGGEMDFMQRRRISNYTGPGGGIIEDGLILGGSGSWVETCNEWNLKVATGTVVLRTTSQQESYTFVRRDSDSEIDATMATDLVILNRDIHDVSYVSAKAVEINGTLSLNSLRIDDEFGNDYEPAFKTFEVRNQATENSDDVPLFIRLNILKNVNVAGSMQLYKGINSPSAALKIQNAVYLNGYLNVEHLKAYDFTVDSLEICKNGSSCDDGDKIYDLTVRSLISYKQLAFQYLKAPYMKVKGPSLKINSGGGVYDINDKSERKITQAEVRLYDTVLMRLNECVLYNRNCPDESNFVLQKDTTGDGYNDFQITFENMLKELKADCSTEFYAANDEDKEKKIQSIKVSEIIRCIEQLMLQFETDGD